MATELEAINPAPLPSITDQLVNAYDTGEDAAAAATPVSQAAVSPVSAGSEQPAVVSPPPAASPRLIHRAKENCGFDDDEIAGMSPAELERTVHRVEQQLLKQRNESRREQSILNALQPPPNFDASTAAHGSATPASAPPTPTPEEADVFADFDPEEVHPAVGKLVDVVRAMRKEIAELRGLKKEFADDKARRADETFSEMCDRVFEGRGDLYGQGNYKTVKAGTPERLRRHTVIQAAGRIANGQPVTPEHILRAEEILFGARATTAPTTEPAPQPAPARQVPPKDPTTGRFMKPEEFAMAGLARPTQRDTDPDLPNGYEKAVQTAARIMGQQAQAGATHTGDENGFGAADDFPG